MSTVYVPLPRFGMVPASSLIHAFRPAPGANTLHTLCGTHRTLAGSGVADAVPGAKLCQVCLAKGLPGYPKRR